MTLLDLAAVLTGLAFFAVFYILLLAADATAPGSWSSATHGDEPIDPRLGRFDVLDFEHRPYDQP